MPLRAPRRIWRFLISDLVRLGFMAAVSLVVVISFAFSVRFLAEGRIDMPGAIRFTVLGMIPMLQYTLPFACGFAATLTYHRFAADNEATAAAAGGIGHRRLLVPAAAAGLLLAAIVGFLAHQVIPRFLRSMEELVTRDLPGILERSITRGESVRLGNIELHARRIVRAGADPSIGAFERLRLTEVLAATLDSQSRVQGYIVADEVSVWLFEEEADGQPCTAAQFQFRGARGEGIGDAVRGGSFASHRLRIPSTFADDPKYLTWSELIALRARPENINRVDALKRALALRLAEAAASDRLASDLAETGSATLVRAGDELVVLHAAGASAEADGWTIHPPAGGTITVERAAAAGRGGPRRLTATSARLEPESAGDGPPRADPLFRLRLRGVILGEDEPQPDDRDGAITITSLAPAVAPAENPASLDIPTLLSRAADETGRRGAEAADDVRAAASQLSRKVESLQREVTSKQHERAAYAVACLLTLLAGAVTAMRRGDSLPLPVYLWSFFPALASVITISAGQGLTHKFGWPGLLLLWGGVGALALTLAREYARLVRH